MTPVLWELRSCKRAKQPKRSQIYKRLQGKLRQMRICSSILAAPPHRSLDSRWTDCGPLTRILHGGIRLLAKPITKSRCCRRLRRNTNRPSPCGPICPACGKRVDKSSLPVLNGPRPKNNFGEKQNCSPEARKLLIVWEMRCCSREK